MSIRAPERSPETSLEPPTSSEPEPAFALLAAAPPRHGGNRLAQSLPSALQALRANKVPAEYLELASGGHGLNGYKGPMWDAWQKRSLAWLAERKLVPAPE